MSWDYWDNIYLASDFQEYLSREHNNSITADSVQSIVSVVHFVDDFGHHKRSKNMDGCTHLKQDQAGDPVFLNIRSDIVYRNHPAGYYPVYGAQ